MYLLKTNVRIIAAMTTNAGTKPFTLFSSLLVKLMTEPAADMPSGIMIASSLGIVFVA
ncbi:MAG: hypothetical protein MR908_04830 [Firmicutes bacterium]|nr:hypothetical protein [Bacillota bacterium]